MKNDKANIDINKKLSSPEGGAALIMIIFSILIVASLGTAMLKSSSSSTSTLIGSVNTLNGYFLAEAGKYYAMSYIKDEIANARNPEDNHSCDYLNNDDCATATPRVFTLPDGAGQFSLKLTVSPVGCDNSTTMCEYTLVSTGIPNASTNRELTFIIAKQ